ncbi:MAG: hypothetical protein KKA07_08180 [Bacteroidetes bacterium]|nr:hypothetical protein [Bacteroidota bacterium]MBU1719037.1 hypothetical protein [Bacteroidota bacterium]
MIKSRLFVLIVFLVSVSHQSFAQKGEIHGSFQTDAQYYREDSVIGAPDVPEQSGIDGFLNLIYTNKDFEAGIRYELYLPPVQGKDPRLEGHGFANRYVKYTVKELEMTAGSFYEQFGNGLILRTYEEWNLGYDNAFDGFRVKYKPSRGVAIKALYGRQRYFWDWSPGIVRGADAEFSLNEMIGGKFYDNPNKIIFGASAVSKFQDDRDPVYKLPENVASFAGRAGISNGKISLNGEYAYKINDPSAVNNLIYKNGEALILNAAYSRKGLGVMLSAKRIDNMNFRSDRTATGNALMINYLPTITMQHSYSLAAMYPYATQPNGEMGVQGQVMYTIKKNTPLGGKYGTKISLHYAIATSIERQQVNDTIAIGQAGTDGYRSDFFALGDEKYFEDFNVQISKKFHKDFKASFLYTYINYNIDVIEGHVGEGMVYAHVGIGDFTYKLSAKKAIRLELQHLYTEQDEKSWAMALAEFSISPKWFFAIGDQYNYGNEIKAKQLHYYTASMGFTKGTNRISLTYGRQREGIICVGGVCRNVPASNGIAITISSSF